QPCIDELEIYGPDGERNLALAGSGAKATASSCLPGYAIHQIPHLNDGLYGNDRSWIAAGAEDQWAQIELPGPAKVAKVIFSRDRGGRYQDRVPVHFEVRLSLDGKQWQTACQIRATAANPSPAQRPSAPPTPQVLPLLGAAEVELRAGLEGDDLLRYAFFCEACSFMKIDRRDPVARVLDQFDEMIARFAARDLDVTEERAELRELRQRYEALLATASPDTAAARSVFFDARLAKRRLMFRDPELASLERVLFVKRHPFLPSHNYSVILDAQGGTGGAVCVLETPRSNGRLQPQEARVVRLFEAEDGIARNPVADFDAARVYFAYRPSKSDYFHLMRMNIDGSGVEPLTDGPFHDYFPCPLPDGGLAFISTRCKCRFLCWRPQAFVLFRMDADGGNIRPLSHANVSEWTPSLLSDGRIIWMRSEYLDKGADFGHTLWAIRPDGTHPELIFGNNTINCYANGREVPGTTEICCTLVSHGGDLNGPIALVDLSRGRFNPAAIRSITPDVAFHTHMSWARQECFRDPVPVARDYFLCSHAPEQQFGLYVIDRFGNRELLHLDPSISSVCPTVLRAVARPPVLSAEVGPDGDEPAMGRFVVADVYQGLEPAVERGRVKYLRICQEVRSDLVQLPGGQYRSDHEPFQDFYATPTHKVRGPHGWPSYVAKGTFGLVPVEEDGSASFYAPAGKQLYFEVLDEDFNELQRMRSVVQLQPGERRSCVGCHENRFTAPPVRQAIALKREPVRPAAPPWGAGPFSYEEAVQPVWDAKCVRCHDAGDEQQIDLSGTLDADGVPASFRTLISQGWVHYFDYTWGREHHKAEPLTFGTVQSKLWQVLEKDHYEANLTTDEMRAVKCWTDLNCPLWPDYRFRPERPKARQTARE
ncbi:MAG TPA: hypothetical protein VMY42_11845, partial [Thermoguttaceae bacterium]|nr:hypothetical protein [Thermoguttaceae bacterium]